MTVPRKYPVPINQVTSTDDRYVQVYLQHADLQPHNTAQHFCQQFPFVFKRMGDNAQKFMHIVSFRLISLSAPHLSATYRSAPQRTISVFGTHLSAQQNLQHIYLHNISLRHTNLQHVYLQHINLRFYAQLRRRQLWRAKFGFQSMRALNCRLSHCNTSICNTSICNTSICHTPI